MTVNTLDFEELATDGAFRALAVAIDEYDIARRVEWVTCPACKRTFRAEIIEVRGSEGCQFTDCPHCEARGVYSVECWCLIAYEE